MDTNIIQQISKEIYRRFPEVQGLHPKVQSYVPPKTRPINRFPTYLLTYKTQVAIADKKMPYHVRVIVNENGKILKITMSH